MNTFDGREVSLMSDEDRDRMRSMSTSMTLPIKENVKRNDPCPCGSGKKFKKCHLGIYQSQGLHIQRNKIDKPT